MTSVKIDTENNSQAPVRLHNRKSLDEKIKIIEMDEGVKLSTQMELDVAPAILINKFTVNLEEADEFLRAWAASAAIMKKQPGLISAQLHHGIGDSSVFINYAIWESTEYFKKGLNNPEFQSSLEELPASTIASPHLFKKVAVPGICGDDE